MVVREIRESPEPQTGIGMAASNALDLMAFVDTIVSTTCENFPVGEKVGETMFVEGVEANGSIFFGVTNESERDNWIRSVVQKMDTIDNLFSASRCSLGVVFNRCLCCLWRVEQ